MSRLGTMQSLQWRIYSSNVVVTTYDFESGRPDSNPEWGPI